MPKRRKTMSSIPKPEKNPLEDLYSLIEKGSITKDLTYRGKVFTFRSLNDEDYIWRDQFVNAATPMALMSSQRAPTLAIATLAIDGVAVEQMGLDQGSGLTENIIAYNLYKNVYSKMPRQYLLGLHNMFVDEVERPSQTVTEEDVKKS
jgi:hypothetical protein